MKYYVGEQLVEASDSVEAVSRVYPGKEISCPKFFRRGWESYWVDGKDVYVISEESWLFNKLMDSVN